MEYQPAKDAVIALVPETANNKHAVWANAWKIALELWKKERTGGTPRGVGGNVEDLVVDQVESPLNSTIRRVEVAGRPMEGGTNITIFVPQGGVGSGVPLLPGGNAQSGSGNRKGRGGNVEMQSGKDLYEFIKPLIKSGIVYERLRNAVEKWNTSPIRPFSKW
jgi:hypothetical protein